MTQIRAYERGDLPLEERLPSLARRFPCLQGAAGIDPWDPEALHRWAQASPEESSARYAATLVLNLWREGPWDRFDILAAARVWEEADLQTFVDWLRVWRFGE